MNTLDAWMYWFVMNWHWAWILGGLLLFLLFGVVGIVVDSDGDWFIF